MRKKILIFLFTVCCIITPVFAQDLEFADPDGGPTIPDNGGDTPSNGGGVSGNNGITPIGANTALDLFSPAMAGRGGFTTSRGGAAASALNPAAEGEAQRIIFDIGYIALPVLGSGNESGIGFGTVNLGAIFPTRYGVFGTSLRFLTSPFDYFPVKTSIQGNVNAAKELYPGMSVGAGFNMGYNSGNGFTIFGDLGFRYNIGKLGPLENFTWAMTMRGIGKSWIPSMFTPAGGVAFDLVHLKGEDGRPDPLRISLAADLLFPTFQNMAGKLGFSVNVAEFINVSASTQFNIRESINGNVPSPIPSIGVGVIWKLKS